MATKKRKKKTGSAMKAVRKTVSRRLGGTGGPSKSQIAAAQRLAKRTSGGRPSDRDLQSALRKVMRRGENPGAKMGRKVAKAIPKY